jgi:oligopeptide/dipeptide ABC transporter ATP-binding protein
MQPNSSQIFPDEDKHAVLVNIVNLTKFFPVNTGFLRSVTANVHAVDGVDLSIYSGETLGLVGESGCGKSTLGKLILRLEKPTDGRIYFGGQDISVLKGSELKDFRKNIQIIFQDPYSSLDPRRTVFDAIAEPLVIHGIGDRSQRTKKVFQLMDEVGLRAEYAMRYPHEFSGGQRQRIGIARALALNPKLMVADEPVSALDVSIRSQVLNLLEDLQEKYGLTYLFISHDLSVVEHISDRVAVMYLGKIVEMGPRQSIYESPLHPYTEALLSALPIPDPGVRAKRIILNGDVPSPIDPPPGCRFHPRCSIAISKCSVEEPILVDAGDNQCAACHVRAPA